MQESDPVSRPVWIRGPQLRRRWGGMPNSSFYWKLRRKLIPAPEYPFGDRTPHWRLDVIEEFEQQTGREAA